VTGIRKNRGFKEVRLFDRFKAISALAEYLNLVRPQGAQVTNIPIVILPPKERMPEEREVTEERGEPENRGAGTDILIFNGGDYEQTR
jgi:hypothetical protein